MSESDGPPPREDQSRGLILVEHLREAREAKGWTLEDVADQTCISYRVLQGLESGRFDVIESPYVRAFLRGYAAAVGVPVEEVNDAFPEAKTQVELPSDDAEERKIPVVPRTRIPWPMLLKSAFGIAVLALVWSWRPWAPGDERTIDPDPVAPVVVEVAALPDSIFEPDTTGAVVESDGDTLVLPDDDLAAEPVLRPVQEAMPPPPPVRPPSVGPPSFEIVATDSVWILVTKTDSTFLYEAIMTEGNRRRWAVVETLRVRLGLHSAVEMTVDGRLVPVPRIGSRRSTEFICTPAGTISRR